MGKKALFYGQGGGGGGTSEMAKLRYKKFCFDLKFDDILNKKYSYMMAHARARVWQKFWVRVRLVLLAY